MFPIISCKHLYTDTGVVTRNTKAYPTRQEPSPSRGTPYSQKRGNDDRVTAE
jgi:hypothetical protein